MHRNTWETDPDPDDPLPLDDDQPRYDPPCQVQTRESVTDAELQRRLEEAISLLRSVRRQEWESARHGASART